MPARWRWPTGAMRSKRFSRVASALYAEVGGHDALVKFTIGRLQVEPNAPSVVPERVTLRIDLRHPDNAVLDALGARLTALCAQHAAPCEARVTPLVDAPSNGFDAALQQAIADAAERIGQSLMPILSAAGHDARHLAPLCPSAMIFIPCRGGVSHAEHEWAEPAHVTAGANVLLQVLLPMRMHRRRIRAMSASGPRPNRPTWPTCRCSARRHRPVRRNRGPASSARAMPSTSSCRSCRRRPSRHRKRGALRRVRLRPVGRARLRLPGDHAADAGALRADGGRHVARHAAACDRRGLVRDRRRRPPAGCGRRLRLRGRRRLPAARCAGLPARRQGRGCPALGRGQHEPQLAFEQAQPAAPDDAPVDLVHCTAEEIERQFAADLFHGHQRPDLGPGAHLLVGAAGGGAQSHADADAELQHAGTAHAPACTPP